MNCRLKVLVSFITFLLSMLSLQAEVRPARLSYVIDSLDNILKVTQDFTRPRLEKVDSLKELMSSKPILQARDFMCIADAYSGLNADSALRYYRAGSLCATAEGNDNLHWSLTIDYAQQLSKIALFPAAFDLLNKIPVGSLELRTKIKFYSVKSQIHIDAVDYSSTEQTHSENTIAAIEALDSLNNYFEENTIGYRMTEAQIHYLSGSYTLALGELNEVFDEIDASHPFYAVVAAMLAKYYKDDPETHFEHLYYLTLSSIADIKKANGESASLARLGGELLKDGDIDRAYTYLTAAGRALGESRSRSMVDLTNPSLILLSTKLYDSRRSKMSDFYVLEILLVVIIIVLLVWIWRIRRSVKRDVDTNEKLKESVSSRESYINQLLHLCSVYVEGLEDFNRLVGRKLMANQTQDLYKMVESGKVLQDQTERFFVVFDAAIFKLFPTFVDDINKLLLPDKQITHTSVGRLTPELRLIAFMRLGVTDSTRISKFLGLSLNTIYTYRNRMKIRAIDRDNFEENIMKIGK